MQTIHTITNFIVEARWHIVAIAISLMITIGAIKAEAEHAFVIESADHGETFAREREVRHNEPQLAEGLLPHNSTGGGL